MIGRRGKDNYIPNYSFEVMLGLFSTLGFSKISNMQTGKECEVIVDGGNADRPYFFEKNKTEPDTIIFEKGMQTGMLDTFYSQLTEGTLIDEIMINVKKDGKREKSFYIEQGIVTKISYSDLNASKGEIMIKRLEMKHTGLVEMTV